jgi:cytochrome c oxidase subunit 2
MRPQRRGLPLRIIAPSLLLITAIVVGGCTQWADASLPQTTVNPASDLNREIVSLYSLIFWMALVVFVGVEGFLLYAIVRFRRRPDNQMPTQTHGNTRLEIAWTIIPAVVLLVIAIPTIPTIFAYDTIPAEPGQRVDVIGHQWWWEFRYPDLGVASANEFHLPVGQTAVFSLHSADVIHSFWVPKMGGKRDVVPQRTNQMWFTPEITGDFPGQCVEFCGTQHANMRLRLIVDTPETFQAWVQQQRAQATQASGSVAEGARLFQQSACPACHTIRGTAARGETGPDLTHVGSRKTIAAGVLDNTPENVKRWIQDAQSVKIGAKMPSFPSLSDSDAAQIAAYLQSLK